MARKGTWIGLGLAVVAVGLARWRWGDLFEPKAVVALLRELGGQPGAVPAFLGLYLVGTTLLLPAVGFHLVAAVVWGYWPGVALSMLALNLVSNLHFWIGRWIGRERVEAWLKRRGWSGAALDANGVWTMVAIRQFPIPFVAVNTAAGASPLKWWQFAVGSGLGAIPPALVYCSFATALLDGAQGARTAALLKSLAGGAAVLLLASAPRLWVRFKARRNRAAGAS